MKVKNLQINEEISRDLYLKNLALGNILGPKTGKPSIDKPWLKYYSDESIKSSVPDNLSVYQYMRSMNAKNPNRIAINYYGNLFTYQDLFKLIDEYASKYSSLGIKEGDIVTICMPSTPETVISFYALNKLGAVCDMLDPRSNPEQMDYYLKQNNSKLLILCENYYKKLIDVCEHSNLSKLILFPITPSAPLKLKLLINAKTKLDNFGAKKSSKVLSWKDFEKLPVSDKFEEKNNSKDLAVIIHSSGTTSLPKGIVLTNKNVNSLAFQYKLTTLNTEPGSKFLSVIPAFASFGIVASINLPLTLSMENILVPIVNSKIFIENMKKNKINFTLTIPSNFVSLSRYNKNDIDLTGLYGPGVGGYSLDSVKEQKVQDYLKAHNSPVPMLSGRGMSELSSTACLEVPECAKMLSSGIPLPKNSVSIFEPKTDRELSYNQEGEICVTGPTIMYGYLNNPQKTYETILKHSDGKMWLHSGDIGVMDEDGRLTVVGRLERMIIKGIDGFKIFPQKIEEVIVHSKYVDACTVVGFNTQECGIVPKAYIVLKDEYKDNKDTAIKEIKELCISKLSIRAIPDIFEVIDSMPYTSMGKVDFKLLAKGLDTVNSIQKIKKN